MNKKISKTKRSIVNNVLIINVSLAALYLIIFGAVIFIYNKNIVHEREQYADSVIAKTMSEFDLELQRLDGLMELCIRKQPFVLSMVTRIDYQDFLKYAAQAASNLSIIKYTLPYADQVFLYSQEYESVLRETGSILDKRTFVEDVLKKPELFLEKFEQMQDGINIINGNMFYIKKYFSYGFVGILIDRGRFYTNDQMMQWNEEIFVFDESGQSVIVPTEYADNQELLKQIASGQDIKQNGKKYICLKKQSNYSQYNTVVVFEKNNIYFKLQYFTTILAIALFTLALSSVLVIWFNVKLYLPLQSMTNRYGRGQNENELYFIENKMQVLSKELTLLKEKKQKDFQVYPEYAVLQCLLDNGQFPKNMDIEAFCLTYDIYSVAAMAIQDASGGRAEEFVSLFKEKILAHITGQLIQVENYVYVLIIKQEENLVLLALFRKLLSEIMPDKNLNIFVGINTNCLNLKQLREQYVAAFSNLLGARIETDEVMHSILLKNRLGGGVRRSINSALKKQLMEAGVNGNYVEFISLVHDIFTFDAETNQISLLNFQELYLEVVNILDSICYINKISIAEVWPRENLYNTVYMITQITDYVNEIGKIFHCSKGDLSNQIIEYVNNNFRSDLSLESVAGEFSITSVYLSSLFKKNMGVNFLAYISKQRMMEARNLLMENQKMKVYEVAKGVGIENTATFIRQFKNHFGTTPEQFRKQLIQQDRNEEKQNETEGDKQDEREYE